MCMATANGKYMKILEDTAAEDRETHHQDVEFSHWLSENIVPRTCESLYSVLEDLDYGKELSERIESYLSGDIYAWLAGNLCHTNL